MNRNKYFFCFGLDIEIFRYQLQRLCKTVKNLTCGIHVKNARLPLGVDLVPAPAQQGSVIEFRERLVEDRAARLVHHNLILRDVHRVGGVVELPVEVHVRGVGLQLAGDAGRLAPGHPEHLRLTRSAHRGD